MFAKINLAFQIVVESNTEITLFSREDEKEFTIQKSSPIYSSLIRSKLDDLTTILVTKTEMCGVVDEIPRNDLFYAEFTKKEDGSKRIIHCQKIKYLADGRVQVIDLELKELRTFYKRDVLHVSHRNKSYAIK